MYNFTKITHLNKNVNWTLIWKWSRIFFLI